MDMKLSKQLQAMIDALELAQTEAAHLTLTMRAQRLSFGLDYNHADHEIAQISTKMRSLKQVVERMELAEVKTQRSQIPDESA